MPTLTPQVIVLTGITPALVAADVGGDDFLNSGRDFIHIKNGYRYLFTLIPININQML